MTEQAQQSPAIFGNYQVLEELGRGGFGTVYHAQDKILGRFVALKVLHPGLVVEPNFINRFRQEARISAALDHPNLVPVYDFGQQDGNYYIAMGYMAGGSLKELLQKQGKLEPQAAYELLEQVGAALSYAHRKGIIHRDLKPGNILLDENGKARVADLGFAKVLSQASSMSMSLSGGLIGTPAYMAPEVWRNKAAQPQTDVYSLGCILHEMLTGKVLFEGDSPAEVMTKHVVDGPEYAPELPEEMRAVLDKALKREPEERYPDVTSMLEDLRSRLKPELEELASLIEPKKPQADKSEGIQTIPVTAQQSQVGNKTREPEILLESNPEVIPFNSEPGEKTSLAYDEQTGTKVKSIRRTRGKIGKPIALVGVVIVLVLILVLIWTSGHPKSPGLPVAAVTSQPTETDVATSTLRATIASTKTMAPSVTPTRTLQPTATITPTPISLLGSTVIGSSNADQVEQLRTLEGHTDGVFSIAWSPDGKRLASGSWDKTIILWDAESGNRLRTLTGRGARLISVAWSLDGKTLALGCNDNTIILRDAASGSLLHTLEGHTDYIVSVAWSPDGETLASGSNDNTIILWDVDSGNQLRTLEGYAGDVYSVAWSPDGKTLASGSFRTIIFWDAESGNRLRTLEGHTDYISGVAWSPDGKTLASGSYDKTIILWDVGDGSQLRTLEGHTDGVVSVAWSPDGKTLATGNWDNTIILWDADSGARLRTIEGHTDIVLSVAWSPDGKTLASGSSDGTIRLWGIN